MSVQSTRWRSALAICVFAIALRLDAAPWNLDAAWGHDGAYALEPGSSLVTSLLQPDGALTLWLKPGAGLRITFDGKDDPTFGDKGRVSAPIAGQFVQQAARRPDGGIDVFWQSEYAPLPFVNVVCDPWRWARYGPDGDPDPAFELREAFDSLCNRWGLTVSPKGIVHYLTASRGLSSQSVSIIRVDESHQPQAAPVTLASVNEDFYKPPIWLPRRLAFDATGRLIVALSKRDAREFGVMRYVDGVPDPTFGLAGTAVGASTGPVDQSGALPLPDGSILTYGLVAVGSIAQPAVARFNVDGSADTTFGTSGVAILPMARDGEALVVPSIAVDAQGRIVVAAQVSSGSREYSRVGRLLADGTPDTRFGGAGVAPTTYGPGVSAVYVRPSGAIVLALAHAVVQLQGGELSLAHPLRERLVVEYFHAGFGHYFMTADEPEQSSLDAATPAAWARTGKSFTVLDSTQLPLVTSTPLVPMCRFWSDQTYAPKSSHFYTPYSDECAAIKASPVWRFERDAFNVQLPVGMRDHGTCMTGAQPLYRAYNNGSGGAPNHRYTADPSVLDAMLAQGWTMEGELATRVFACIPTQAEAN